MKVALKLELFGEDTRQMMKMWNGEMESQFEYLTRVIPMCGAAGRSRYLKHVKNILA